MREARRASRRRALLAWAALTGLSGCGFELRRSPAMPFSRIALSGFAPRSPLELELRQALARQVQVLDAPAQADVVLRASTDAREKVVVASTSASQVREVQLRLRVRFRILTGAGRELAPDAELLLVRDLSTNETQALAKQHEEAQLYRDMQADIVAQLLRRLSAVRL
jgi:LPS-assembly lipoprotein